MCGMVGSHTSSDEVAMEWLRDAKCLFKHFGHFAVPDIEHVALFPECRYYLQEVGFLTIYHCKVLRGLKVESRELDLLQSVQVEVHSNGDA